MRRLTCLAALGLIAVSLAACGRDEDTQVTKEALLPSGAEVDLFHVSEAVWAREAALGVDALSSAERVFLCVWNLEAEVNNGGFEQFYMNSAGDNAVATPAALREIGATSAAEIAQAANRIFGPNGPPADRDVRTEALDTLGTAASEALGELDTRFYEYPDNLEALLLRFVDHNRGQFFKAAHEPPN